MINFLHNWLPSPVLMQVGPVKIYWYGLIMVAAMVLGVAVAGRLAEEFKVKKEELYDVTFWLIIWGLIGARLYHVLLDWGYYSEYPLEIVKIWHGGLAIHGAVLAAIAVVLWWTKASQEKFWLVTGVLAPAVAFGQALGRWGNYFNQELFGRPTDWPWGIIIEAGRRPMGYEGFSYFQPTFLYESLTSLVLGLSLVYLVKIKRQMDRVQLARLTFGLYLSGFGLYRGLIEFIKIDFTPVLWGLRWPQWMSLILIVVGGIILTLYASGNRHNASRENI